MAVVLHALRLRTGQPVRPLLRRLAGGSQQAVGGARKHAQALTCCPDEYRLWVLGLFRWLRLWLSLSGRSVGMHEQSPPKHLPVEDR